MRLRSIPFWVSATLALLGALSGPAAATVRETFSYTNVASNGLLGSPANSVRSPVFVGGYPLGRIDVSGTLTSLNANTFASDAQILITSPGGATYTFHPFDGIGLFTTQNFSRPFFVPGVGDPAGTWTMRFYEVVDNGGTASIDASWNITFNITDEPPVPPAGTNLGTIVTPGVSVPTFTIGSTGYVWYQFTLSRSVLPALGRYLDISVSSPDPSPDTEIALFNSSGTLVASDDDSGPGLLSQLSFGAGTRPAIADGQPFDGRNGALNAGTYYLAVGKYHLQYTSDPWGIVFAGSGTMNAAFQINTNLQPGVDCFAPTISQQPQGVMAFPGQTVHFTTAASGTGTLTYQWQLLGVNISDGGPISGSTTPSLTIAGVRSIDGGAYTAVVTNACGSTTTSAAALVVACSADFNGDGAVGTDADIDAFFSCLSGTCCPTCGSADFNGDGAVGTDADIESFFRVLAGGAC
jgi:hypothetical protein